MSSPTALGARILVAEDNLVNQKVTRGMLQKLGCDVEIAETGWQAVKAIEKQHFDMVLMDCQMPELDGFEATRLIRQMDARESRIPVIALTAHAVSGDRHRCLEAGMDDYLSKPVRMEVLAATVKKWLQHI